MTSSLTADTLVDATTEELLTYLRSGAANTRALTNSLDYDGLDITDWERLKRIHFCLADEVQEFIAALPDRVRRIKTEHQRENIRTQGEVRGSINWSETLRTWSETGYADRSRYVCNTPYTEYNIGENRVLKRLLWHIHRTVTSELGEIDYDWRRAYWTDDQITRFDRLYKQNIHLNRISDGQTISVSDGDMNTARQSRLPLYNEAYQLYEQYQRLQADTFDTDIAELLANTLIVPTDTPRLFELFCVFRLIRHLNTQTPGFHLNPIDGTHDALAQLTTDTHRIDVYHDAIGTLHFHEKLDPDRVPEHLTFKRYQDAIVDYTDALNDLTGEDHDPVLYNGRPDIIIEIYETTGADEKLCSVLIGEIKHTSNKQTFKQGLEELATYRQFADRDGYLLDSMEVSVDSLLITNGVTSHGTSQAITHMNGTDLLDSSVSDLLDFPQATVQLAE
jgi:hypothetical protein